MKAGIYLIGWFCDREPPPGRLKIHRSVVASAVPS